MFARLPRPKTAHARHQYSLPLFAELPAPAIEGLAAALTLADVPAGTVLIRQDDPGDAYYAIGAGSLMPSRTGASCGGADGARGSGKSWSATTWCGTASPERARRWACRGTARPSTHKPRVLASSRFGLPVPGDQGAGPPLPASPATGLLPCCLCTNMWMTCVQWRRACAYVVEMLGIPLPGRNHDRAFTWESASRILCMQRKSELSTCHASIDNK